MHNLKNGQTYFKNLAMFGYFLSILKLTVSIGLLKVKLDAMLSSWKMFLKFRKKINVFGTLIGRKVLPK